MGEMARQIVDAVRGYQSAHPDVDWSTNEVMVRYADGVVNAVGHRPKDERTAEAIRRCCCHPDLPRGHERGEALPRRSDPAVPAPARMREYGTAELRRDDDGTITVVYADPVIGITRELLESQGPPHRRPGGRIWLDTEGIYEYAFLYDIPHLGSIDFDTLVYQRIHHGECERPLCDGCGCWCHAPAPVDSHDTQKEERRHDA